MRVLMEKPVLIKHTVQHARIQLLISLDFAFLELLHDLNKFSYLLINLRLVSRKDT